MPNTLSVHDREVTGVKPSGAAFAPQNGTKWSVSCDRRRERRWYDFRQTECVEKAVQMVGTQTFCHDIMRSNSSLQAMSGVEGNGSRWRDFCPEFAKGMTEAEVERNGADGVLTWGHGCGRSD